MNMKMHNLQVSFCKAYFQLVRNELITKTSIHTIQLIMILLPIYIFCHPFKYFFCVDLGIVKIILLFPQLMQIKSQNMLANEKRLFFLFSFENYNTYTYWGKSVPINLYTNLYISKFQNKSLFSKLKRKLFCNLIILFFNSTLDLPFNDFYHVCNK